MKPRLVGERRFGDAWQMAVCLSSLLGLLKETDIPYVKTYTDIDGGYAELMRLWEETLTDGSKTYTLHIL